MEKLIIHEQRNIHGMKGLQEVYYIFDHNIKISVDCTLNEAAYFSESSTDKYRFLHALSSVTLL